MAAINSFCYREHKCLRETEIKDREVKKMMRILKNNNYNTKIVDKVIENIHQNKRTMQSH